MAWSPLKRYFLATLVFSVCSVIACGTSIFGPRKTHGSHYQKFPNRTAALITIGVLIQNALIKPESVGIPKVEQVSPTSGNKNIALSHQPKSEHNETMN